MIAVAALGKPLEWIANKLVGQHDRKEDYDRKLAERKTAALKDLLAILGKTVGYVEGLPAGYDRLKEMDLATGWGNAMMSCQEFFEDQDVFWMWRKSVSWMSNEVLTPDELREMQIDLPTVQKKVTELVLGNQVEKHTKHHKKRERPVWAACTSCLWAMMMS